MSEKSIHERLSALEIEVFGVATGDDVSIDGRLTDLENALSPESEDAPEVTILEFVGHN